MRSLNSFYAVTAAALVLSACAGTELERTSGMTPTGSEFNRSLFGEYVALSRSEYNQGDYGDSDAYALRARSVGQGTMVEPQEVTARTIPADKAPELTASRGRLMTALRGGARERLPRDAAQAQAMFDCWLEQQEENHQPAHIAACRDGFMAALARIEVAPTAQPAARPAGSQAFTVAFDLNKATLNDAANAEIRRAVAHARSINAQWVVLEGHADRSGPDSHNMRLSQSRVAAVRQAIQGSGVNVQFRDSAEGENRPIVQTADGVREARNRVVIVRVVP
jgi:outer membrane protein OmpA-like peptidoglycan-associated protein